MWKPFALCILVACFIFFWGVYISQPKEITIDKTPLPQAKPPSPFIETVSLASPPEQKVIISNYHVFQTFNNCGPAAFSMALSFYGIHKSQEELGRQLRPYQNPQGDNDDKSVTLEELSRASEEYGFIPFHRPNGSIELIKYFITYDIPIIARTWTKPNEDIGHYRVVKGYDDLSQEIIQDDSLQDKNLRFTYDTFNLLWEKFNYEYLILVPKDKVET